MFGLSEREREIVCRIHCQAQVFCHMLEGKLRTVVVLSQLRLFEFGQAGMGHIPRQGFEVGLIRNARGASSRSKEARFAICRSQH